MQRIHLFFLLLALVIVSCLVGTNVIADSPKATDKKADKRVREFLKKIKNTQ